MARLRFTPLRFPFRVTFPKEGTAGVCAAPSPGGEPVSAMPSSITALSWRWCHPCRLNCPPCRMSLCSRAIPIHAFVANGIVDSCLSGCCEGGGPGPTRKLSRQVRHQISGTMPIALALDCGRAMNTSTHVSCALCDRQGRAAGASMLRKPATLPSTVRAETKQGPVAGSHEPI